MTLLEGSAPPVADARTALPVVIIGAGPVGLAAAAHLLERGIEPLVLEQGDHAGAAVTAWGHTRLFSPWKHVVDAAGVRLLTAAGWKPQHPDAAPTGHDLVKYYLAPLAATPELRDRIRYGVRVEGVSRVGMDRTRTTGRADTPFTLMVDDGDERSEIQARAVIDASGTFSSPNQVIASGFRPRHAAQIEPNLSHGLPDVLGRDRERFAGKHTVVVGAGHSAANTLLALGRLVEREPGTSVTWLIRNESPVRVFGSEDDELSARASLGSATHELVRSGAVALLDRFLIADIVPAEGGRVVVTGTRNGESATVEADTIVVATGFRPDLEMLREIRLTLDEVVEAPAQLAPLIDPNVHSCGTVPPHGVSRAVARRAGLLARGHEVVRPRSDLPAADRLRAGAVHRR